MAVLLFFQGFLLHCYIAFKKVHSCSAPLDIHGVFYEQTSGYAIAFENRFTFSSQLYSAVWRDIELEPFGGN